MAGFLYDPAKPSCISNCTHLTLIGFKSEVLDHPVIKNTTLCFIGFWKVIVQLPHPMKALFDLHQELPSNHDQRSTSSAPSLASHTASSLGPLIL
jgi:hypothetical protein